VEAVALGQGVREITLLSAGPNDKPISFWRASFKPQPQLRATQGDMRETHE
jgi:hypothetical protein